MQGLKFSLVFNGSIVIEVGMLESMSRKFPKELGISSFALQAIFFCLEVDALAHFISIKAFFDSQFTSREILRCFFTL